MKEEILSFIGEFIDTVSSRSAQGDHNAMAQVLERWQLFEMEFEAQPAVIKRVVKLIVEDVGFSRRLDTGVREKAPWLRDTAGIIFRFYGMCRDGELAFDDPGHGRRLQRAVEVILEPFERKVPVTLHGHFYGAIYMQAMVPWLCAWRGGMSTIALQATVQRVVRAIVHVHRALGKRSDLRQQVTERIHPEYVTLSHTAVWGSQEADPVWCTFYK